MLEKDKIILFAQQSLLSSGVSVVTMDEIAKQMHISKKTIYKHFASKEDLVREVTFVITHSIRKSIEDIVNDPMNSVEKLHSVGKVLYGFILRVSDRWINDLKIHYYNLWCDVDNFRTKVIDENFSKIISQGIEEGFIVNKPTEIILAVVSSSIRSVINPDFLMNNSFTALEAAQISLDIVFNGIFTKQGRKVYKQLNRK